LFPGAARKYGRRETAAEARNGNANELLMGRVARFCKKETNGSRIARRARGVGGNVTATEYKH
jgi:S-adenosylhomocysteine hydrolase